MALSWWSLRGSVGGLFEGFGSEFAFAFGGGNGLSVLTAGFFPFNFFFGGASFRVLSIATALLIFEGGRSRFVSFTRYPPFMADSPFFFFPLLSRGGSFLVVLFVKGFGTYRNEQGPTLRFSGKKGFSFFPC